MPGSTTVVCLILPDHPSRPSATGEPAATSSSSSAPPQTVTVFDHHKPSPSPRAHNYRARTPLASAVARSAAAPAARCCYSASPAVAHARSSPARSPRLARPRLPSRPVRPRCSPAALLRSPSPKLTPPHRLLHAGRPVASPPLAIPRCNPRTSPCRAARIRLPGRSTQLSAPARASALGRATAHRCAPTPHHCAAVAAAPPPAAGVPPRPGSPAAAPLPPAGPLFAGPALRLPPRRPATGLAPPHSLWASARPGARRAPAR
nr:uncharacterized protein DKFZp434B061-like [Aegilops tauschii subsp. strangulata]